MTTAKAYRLGKQPVNTGADPSISPEQQESLLHEHKSDEELFIESNRKIGPQFSTVDDSDDPAIYKIMPDIIEPVTTKRADRVIVRAFPSGNRGKCTIHLPDWMKDRLGIKYAFEGFGVGENLLELEMDPDWRYVTIKKVPRLNNNND